MMRNMVVCRANSPHSWFCYSGRGRAARRTVSEKQMGNARRCKDVHRWWQHSKRYPSARASATSNFDTLPHLFSCMQGGTVAWNTGCWQSTGTSSINTRPTPAISPAIHLIWVGLVPGPGLPDAAKRPRGSAHGSFHRARRYGGNSRRLLLLRLALNTNTATPVVM